MKIYKYINFNLNKILRRYNKNQNNAKLAYKLSGYNPKGGDFTSVTGDKNSYTYERNYISRRKKLENAVENGKLPVTALDVLPETRYMHKDANKAVDVRMNQDSSHTDIHRKDGHTIYLKTADDFDHEDAHGYQEVQPDYIRDWNTRTSNDSHGTLQLQGWEGATDGLAIENQNKWAKENGLSVEKYETPQSYIDRLNKNYDQMRNEESYKYYNNPFFRQIRQNDLNTDVFKSISDYENFLNNYPKEKMLEFIEPARYNFLMQLQSSGKNFRDLIGFRMLPPVYGN